jgi:hypothetical protein
VPPATRPTPALPEAHIVLPVQRRSYPRRLPTPTRSFCCQNREKGNQFLTIKSKVPLGFTCGHDSERVPLCPAGARSASERGTRLPQVTRKICRARRASMRIGNNCQLWRPQASKASGAPRITAERRRRSRRSALSVASTQLFVRHPSNGGCQFGDRHSQLILRNRWTGLQRWRKSAWVRLWWRR